MLSRPRAKARIQRKRLGLTWPQTEGNKEDLLQQLMTSLARYGIEYAIVCKEFHEDHGTHFHAFVLLKQKVRFRSLSVFDFHGRHCNVEEIVSVKNWIQYCKKGGDWVDCGEDPLKRQKMDKKEKVRFMLEKTLDEVIDSGQYSIFELCKRQQLLQMVQNANPIWPSYRKRKVTWLHGGTGVGKTRYAVEMAERLYKNSWCMLTGDLRTFLNGYDKQQCVIFDDLRAGSLRFERLLQLTDGYRLFVNVKGGFVEWLAESIIITAPVPPEKMFINRENGEPWDNLEQLLRRIDEVREFTPHDTQFLYEAPPAPGPHDVPYLPGETQEQLTSAPTEEFPTNESIIVGDAFMSF